MALAIVWRNPAPLIRIKRTLQRIRSDQFGTVYAITYRNLSEHFELLSKVA
jgi:hypothetical protein